MNTTAVIGVPFQKPLKFLLYHKISRNQPE